MAINRSPFLTQCFRFSDGVGLMGGGRGRGEGRGEVEGEGGGGRPHAESVRAWRVKRAERNPLTAIKY